MQLLHKEILNLNEALTKLQKVVSVYCAISEYAEAEHRNGVDSLYTINAIQKIIKDHDLIFQLKVFEAKPIEDNISL